MHSLHIRPRSLSESAWLRACTRRPARPCRAQKGCTARHEQCVSCTQPLQTQFACACLPLELAVCLPRARRTGRATVCCFPALKGWSLCRSQWQPSQPRQREVYWLSEAAAPSAPARPPPQRFTLLGPWLAGLVVVCTTICFLCSAAAAFILYVRPLLQARHRLLCRAASCARAVCLLASVVSGLSLACIWR